MLTTPQESRTLLRRSGVSCLLLALGALSPPVAHCLSLELEARFWLADATVDAVFREVDLGLDLDLDLGGELGLDSADALEGRLILRPGLGFFIRVGYLDLSVGGGSASGLELGGIPIPLETEVAAALDFEYGRAAFGWQFTAPGKTVRVGPFVEVKGLRGKASIEARLPPLRASRSEDFETAYASVGALLEVRPMTKLQLFAELSELLGEDEIDLTDAEVGARYYPVEPFGIGGGYRWLQVDGELDGARLDLDFEGFFVTAVLGF